jgi:hypothetical protein
MSYIISGIQQLGVGNTNVQETFAWYRKAFGTDIKIFALLTLGFPLSIKSEKK